MESAVSLLQEHESQDSFALVSMAKIVPVLVRTIELVPIQENMLILWNSIKTTQPAVYIIFL